MKFSQPFGKFRRYLVWSTHWSLITEKLAKLRKKQWLRLEMLPQLKLRCVLTDKERLLVATLLEKLQVCGLASLGVYCRLKIDYFLFKERLTCNLAIVSGPSVYCHLSGQSVIYFCRKLCPWNAAKAVIAHSPIGRLPPTNAADTVYFYYSSSNVS